MTWTLPLPANLFAVRIAEEGNNLRLKMIDGIEVVISRKRVKQFTASPCLLDQFDTRWKQVSKTDADKLFTLASWCEEQGVWGGRVQVLQRILELDPNHGATRQLLGFQQFENSWHKTDELNQLTRQPLTAEQRAAAENKLNSWVAATENAPGLHLSSAPAGLCVHVALRADVAADKFGVSNIKYLKGRTPLSLDLPAGKYIVAIERVTAKKTEYCPESGGFYSGSTKGGFLYAPLFEIDISNRKGTYLFGRFLPQDGNSDSLGETTLPPTKLFEIQPEEFSKWAKGVELPAARRAELLDSLQRLGKAVYSLKNRVYIVQYAGKDALDSFSLVRS